MAPSAKRKKIKKQAERKEADGSASPEDAPSDVDDRLATAGEAFLAMFDGPPIVARRKPVVSKVSSLQAPQAGASSSSAVSAKAEETPVASKGPRRGKKRKRKDEAESQPTVSSPKVQPSKSPRLAPGSPKPATVASSPAEVPKVSSKATERPAPRVLQVPGRPMGAAERRRFMSDKVDKIRSKPIEPEQRKGGKKKDSEEDAFFKQTLKDVLNYVTPQLGKQERKQHEQATIRALGGTLEKRPHEPYSHVQRQLKSQERGRQLRLAEEKIMGVSFSANQQRRTNVADSLLRRNKEEKKAKQRRKENEILSLGMGAKESRGMAVIPKRALKAYQQSGR
eukprot:TRINITY_DN5164_c0_g3_i1.p1 TRINITY_DN5164_c0_g3~~TRINITY_DN5164_c0_g3_i1.p1  ORF type:complete len:359 (+),score=106.72 TRINITY_DN5164_c0_g3_i1:65-1078(+)